MPVTVRGGRALALLVLGAGPLLPVVASAAPAGELDLAFGDRGRVRLATGAAVDGESAAVLVQPDGKVVIAGRTNAADGDDFYVSRLRPDGSPDTTFGTAGRIAVDFGGRSDRATGIALQRDGRIVVAGRVTVGDATALGLARLDPDGRLDPAFDGDGRATALLPGGIGPLVRVRVARDGAVMVATAMWNGVDTDAGFARFRQDGTRDMEFGAGGVLVVGAGRTEWPTGLLELDDGRFVACGTSDSGGWDPDGRMFAIRFDATGQVDSTFGAGGLWLRDAASAGQDAQGCALLPDGSLVLVGWSGGAARVDPDGRLATAFWSGGTTTLARDADRVIPTAIVAMHDGRVAIAGGFLPREMRNRSPGDMFVAVLDPATGQLDPTFGDRGTTLVDFRDARGYAGAEALALAQQDDGALVLLGDTFATTYGIGLARVRTDGVGSAGIVAFVETPPTVAENSDGSVTLHVRRSGGSAGAVSVRFRTESVTATTGADFRATEGVLEWRDGETGTQSLAIPVVFDGVREPAETFRVVLSSASPALAQPELVVTITDPAPLPGDAEKLPPTSSGGGGALGACALSALLALAALRAALRTASRPRPRNASARQDSTGGRSGRNRPR